jgi:hypothetical protein
MRRLLPITSSIVFLGLSACAGTPPHAKPKSTVAGPDDAQSSALYARLEQDARRYEGGLDLARSGKPAQAEIEIWLPVADAITLSPGAEVDFFLNVAPESPLRASLRQASYEATQSSAGLLGYRLKATLSDPAHPPRIGLKGTAKVFGERVSLFYYLLRRPLAAARQYVGF